MCIPILLFLWLQFCGGLIKPSISLKKKEWFKLPFFSYFHPYIPIQLFNTPTHSLHMRYEYNCMLLFNYRKNLTCKMMGWKVPLHCYFFFFSSSFSDYVSWSPLLSDDKQNFHVLCIINPSLPLFMPTLPLSRAHA